MPSEGKIRVSLNAKKNGKAPGGDDILAELLKLGGEVVVQRLLHLVWNSETMPEDWLRQLTIPLHKKGSALECDNYRGIALLRVSRKVFCRVVQMRQAQRAEQVLRENQRGFHKGRGYID